MHLYSRLKAEVKRLHYPQVQVIVLLIAPAHALFYLVRVGDVESRPDLEVYNLTHLVASPHFFLSLHILACYIPSEP